MIRLAAPEDAETVAELLIAFCHWWGDPDDAADDVMRATVHTLVHDPNTEFLLGNEDQAVAQLRYRLSAWTGTEDCWLEDVFVREEARGTGLGKAITQAAIDRATDRGCKRIELDVNAQNTRAHDLYVSLGFLAEPKPPGRTYFLGKKLD